MKQRIYVNYLHRLDDIHNERLSLRRIYRDRKGKLDKDEREDMLDKLLEIEERCGAIVDYFRNEVFPGIRLTTALKKELMGSPDIEVWEKAEKQMDLIRWLEDCLIGECLEHVWKPETVVTNSGRDKWILVCQDCGKEYRKLTPDIKKKYNLE